MDLSSLDKKYFIDNYIYNCPFCKRNNVTYSLVDYFAFDWSNEKKCYGYLVKCGSTGCGKISLHWSWEELRQYYITDKLHGQGHYSSDTFNSDLELDDHFFYSRPTSSLTLDENIPKALRELLIEAEQSLQANFLVGSSACLRKVIYELIRLESSRITKKDGKTDYQASIRGLKEKFATVDRELFDALGSIQELSSDQLHEESWKEWDTKKLKFLIELTKTILDEMYLIPVIKKNRLKSLT